MMPGMLNLGDIVSKRWHQKNAKVKRNGQSAEDSMGLTVDGAQKRSRSSNSPPNLSQRQGGKAGRWGFAVSHKLTNRRRLFGSKGAKQVKAFTGIATKSSEELEIRGQSLCCWPGSLLVSAAWGRRQVYLPFNLSKSEMS